MISEIWLTFLQKSERIYIKYYFLPFLNSNDKKKLKEKDFVVSCLDSEFFKQICQR